MGDNSSRKVLIVDDSYQNVKLLQAALEGAQESYQILEADNGQSALDIVIREMPDIILSDIHMPGMDGHEFCKRLKADDKYKSIPVIFITAFTEPAEKARAFGMGAADYITKPINLVEVRARVSAQLKIKDAEDYRLQAERLQTLKDVTATYNHHMNQHLQAGHLDLYKLFKKFPDENNEIHKMLVDVKNDLRQISEILRKIEALENVQRTDYAQGMTMIDLDQ
ncbi:MAG: response regulator [Candidatus Omnitrophica bacterium]|nr:response regulator [Candidatus Omnitrophota bacterium]